MGEMVERVAKELALEDGYDDWVILTDMAKDHFKMMARVAIRAMRELPESPGQRYANGEYSRKTHEAMIEDALS